jgi:hypothetical protein
MRFELRFYEDEHGRRPPANAFCCASSATLTATALSCCSAEISRIERGQANPTTATLGALTGALGLDVQLVPGHRPA